MNRTALIILVLLPFQVHADQPFVTGILFSEPCIAAIQAAVAFSNDEDVIFREDEKAAAFAFILGLGSKNSRMATWEEAYGRGLGDAAYFCDRNPDVSIYEIGRIIGREPRLAN